MDRSDCQGGIDVARVSVGNCHISVVMRLDLVGRRSQNSGAQTPRGERSRGVQRARQIVSNNSNSRLAQINASFHRWQCACIIVPATPLDRYRRGDDNWPRAPLKA